MDLGLTNKVALIVGGSSGVGFATAKLFIEEGARGAIAGRSEARLRRATDGLGKAGSDDFVAVSGDATVEADVRRFADEAARRLGGIDILVNSAGRSLMAHFFDVTDQQWD